MSASISAPLTESAAAPISARGQAAGDSRAASRQGTYEIALPLLIQLRWLAAGGQAVLLGFGYFLYDAELPYAALSGLIALLLASNGLLRVYGPRLESDLALLAVLSLDTLLLTSLLALSGGPHNPFAALYVVHVALGAVTTSIRGTTWIACLSGLCYGALFRWHVPQALWHGGLALGNTGHADHAAAGHAAMGEAGAHLYGMWVALSVVAAVIAYFITRLVQQLSEARARAARNDRLASLTTLAAGAAHELGSPLGTIAVAASEIARTTTGAIADDAKLIRDEVRRCRSILDRMSGSAGGLDATALRASIAETVEQLRGELGARANALELRCDARTLEESVSREPIQQALRTLVVNAFDASQEIVVLEIERQQGELIFRVIDRGPGVPDSILPRIGEPFVTTKEPGKGTGLGLYVVQLIAEQLGGRFSLRSERGVGTEATLALPRETAGVGPALASSRA